MPISLVAVESFPIYESDGTSTDHDFGTVQFISASGQILGQLRVLMTDLDLGGMSVEDMRTAVDAAGAQAVAVVITVSQYLTLEAGSFVLTGQTLDLIRPSTLTLSVGAFVLSGQDLMLRQGRLELGAGAFVLTGHDFNLA